MTKQNTHTVKDGPLPIMPPSMQQKQSLNVSDSVSHAASADKLNTAINSNALVACRPVRSKDLKRPIKGYGISCTGQSAIIYDIKRDNMDTKQRLEYLFYILRQKVTRAREAKAMGWSDLFKYSIKTAEELVAEIEKLLT